MSDERIPVDPEPAAPVQPTSPGSWQVADERLRDERAAIREIASTMEAIRLTSESTRVALRRLDELFDRLHPQITRALQIMDTLERVERTEE
jgi:hypothetical protein